MTRRSQNHHCLGQGDSTPLVQQQRRPHPTGSCAARGGRGPGTSESKWVPPLKTTARPGTISEEAAYHEHCDSWRPIFPEEEQGTARASWAAVSWGCDVTGPSRRPQYPRLLLPPSWPAPLPVPLACPRLLSHDLRRQLDSDSMNNSHL